MPDIWMDVDVALAEVPVNILPLIDDTDFKTREVAIAYNAAGMDLVWNFVTPAGAMTQTAITPTTGGDYDWAHQGDGMYSIEIPASAGASINNDTEGFGWFSGFVTGVLPWRGPTIGFRAAGLNNLLVKDAFSATRGLTGTALPAVAAEAAGGLYTRGSGPGQLNQQANGQVDANLERILNVAQSVTDLKDFADDGYDPATNKVEGVKLADTVTTYTGNTPQSGDVFPLASTEIADIKTKTDQLVFTTANRVDSTVVDKTGFSLSVAGIAALWDALLTGITTAGSVGKLIKDNLDAAITSRSSHSAADVWASGTRTLTSMGTLVADIWANATRTLSAFAFGVTVTTNNDKTGYSLATAPPTTADIWAHVIEGTTTAEQSLRLANSANGAKTNGSPTAAFNVRDLADTKNRVAATVDANGNRTAVTRDLT